MTVDTSQITLDVIEAIKENKSVSFKYGGHETIRVIKPQGFYGDFTGFEGTDENTEEKEFRRFGLARVSEWLGRENVCMVHVEPIAFTFHPTWSEVKHRLQELIDFEDLEYGVEIVDDENYRETDGTHNDSV
jgi:hypothetical protein